MSSGDFTFVEGSLDEADGFAAVPWAEIGAVFHLGAAGVKAGARDWATCVRVNIGGTLNLLRRLDGKPAVPLVYAHTFYEDFVGSTPALAENPYVVTKHAATRLVEDFALRHPGAVVTAKLFQVYGPGDAPSNLIPYAARQLRAGEPALLGSGEGLRDWLHVSDVASGLAACLAGGQPGRLRQFELGSGELYSIRQAVETLADAMGRPRSLLRFDPALDRGDTRIAAKARQLPPDWHPRFTLATGLADLAEASA
jgi:nucleoside-diphosphate-sugar epimerase